MCHYCAYAAATIQVSKPYFNEPGYEASAGTPAGEERSRDYNENIRLHTMRHAMRDMLKRPPYGLEEVGLGQGSHTQCHRTLTAVSSHCGGVPSVCVLYRWLGSTLC